MSAPPDILLFFGRFHPLLVHLPIGLVFLLFVLEVLARKSRFRQANSNAGLILALAVPLAVLSAVFGWLLSLAGGYDAWTLGWHKWTGVATAALTVVAGVLYRLELRKAYRYCLAGTFGLVMTAGHFGGSLTHGSDYLFRYAPGPIRALFGPAGQTLPRFAGDPSTAPAFAAIIGPILEDKCAGCHGAEKSKGGLRLDSSGALMKGGDSGPAVAAGKSADSEVIRRLLLPLDDDDHMPPDGKPQPSPEDIALLRWWIDSGADPTKTVGGLQPPPDVARMINSRLGAAPPAGTGAATGTSKPPVPRDQILAVAEALSRDLGVAITPLSETEPWLQCNASVAGPSFGDAELARLAPLAANCRWLDLAGTSVTDASLEHLGEMVNLTRLHLERTAVTDAGLERLGRLVNLDYLNLYGTQTTDAALERLKSLPRLKQVYLWQTKVTPAAAQAFADTRTDKAQVKLWLDEIEELKKKIRDQEFRLDLGVVTSAPAATASALAPANQSCPLSGKPVNTDKTVLFENRVIAFCCDDCKAKFEQTPALYAEKLKVLAPDNASAK